MYSQNECSKLDVKQNMRHLKRGFEKFICLLSVQCSTFQNELTDFDETSHVGIFLQVSRVNKICFL